MFEAARVDDEIGHSAGMLGLIGGTLLGGIIAVGGAVASGFLIGVGIGLSCIGVGVLVVGAGLALGYLSGVAAEAVRDKGVELGKSHLSVAGKITLGSPNVFINSKAAVNASLSQVLCDDHNIKKVAQGSETVFINGMPATRKDEKTECDATIMSGSNNVFIGGPTVTTEDIDPEIPDWAYLVSDAIMILAGMASFGGAVRNSGKLFLLIQKFSKYANKIPGITQLRKIACVAGKALILLPFAGLFNRPIEIMTGQKFLDDEDDLDFILPSRFPIVWQRVYHSARSRDSILGVGWSLFFESSLTPHEDGLLWRNPEGDVIPFPFVPKGHQTFCPTEQCYLHHLDDDSWVIWNADEIRYHYPPIQTQEVFLEHMALDSGDKIRCIRNEQHLIALEDSAGQRLDCHYQNNRLVRVTQTLDAQIIEHVAYHYDALGQLVDVVCHGESRRQFAWHDQKMVMHRDSRGHENHYAWQEIDGLLRVVRYWNNQGLEYQLTYEENFRQCIDHKQQTQRWWLNEAGLVERYEDVQGNVYQLAYDAYQQLIEIIRSDEHLIVLAWDKLGRLLTETDPLGRKTQYTYHRDTSRLTGTFLSDGTRYEAKWDNQGRLLEEKDALGHITHYRYPETSTLPESIIDPMGNTVRLVWDIRGLLLSYEDCSGSVTHYAYDARGQVQSVTDALAQQTHYRWSQAGRLSSLQFHDGSEEHFEWDKAGQIICHVNSAGHKRHWTYNSYGYPVRYQDKLSRLLTYDYDEWGNLLQLDNGNGGQYRFERDSLGRLISETRPDNTVQLFEYDKQSFLSVYRQCGQPNAAGERPVVVTRFTRDAVGRLLTKTLDDVHYHYEWDERDRLTSAQQLPTTLGDALGLLPNRIVFRYDRLGRLIQEQTESGTQTYHYDVLSNLKQLDLADGNQLSWLRYGSGHVLGMALNGQSVTDFERDSLHREQSRTQGALTQHHRYDARGRKSWQSSIQTRLSHALQKPEDGFLWRQYGYTQNGDVMASNDALRGTYHYDHDAEGRILSVFAQRTGRYQQQMHYDAADNLLNVPVGFWDEKQSKISEALHDNRLLSYQHLLNRYDAFGNLIERHANGKRMYFRYNASQQLIGVRFSEHTQQDAVRYHYDALGRRIAKLTQQNTETPVRTEFIWQGLKLLQERTVTKRRTWFYDPNDDYNPVACAEQFYNDPHAEVFYYHNDLNGFPLDITNAEGKLVWSRVFNGLGKQLEFTRDYWQHSQTVQTFDQPLRFQGQYFDAETGLHYNTFRYYDPESGRFTQPDPIGLLGGINLYQYAPNPLLWVDPLGLKVLYRGMSNDEFESIMTVGWGAGNGTLEGKWFAESYKDAVTWGNKMGHGRESYRIVQLEIPDHIANQMHADARLDGIGPARYANVDDLNKYGKITWSKNVRVVNKC